MPNSHEQNHHAYPENPFDSAHASVQTGGSTNSDIRNNPPKIRENRDFLEKNRGESAPESNLDEVDGKRSVPMQLEGTAGLHLECGRISKGIL